MFDFKIVNIKELCNFLNKNTKYNNFYLTPFGNLLRYEEDVDVKFCFLSKEFMPCYNINQFLDVSLKIDEFLEKEYKYKRIII